MAIIREGENIRIEPRDDLLRKMPTLQRVDEALRDLHGILAVATELTEKLGDHGKAGIFRAMCAVMDFLETQGIPRATMYPFFVVAHAIVDADRGVLTKAFAPASIKGRPPVPMLEAAHRAQTAVIVECCIRQKKIDGAKAYKKEGLRDAKSILRKCGWGDRSEAELAQTREDVTGRPSGDPIRDEFERMLESSFVASNPQGYAKVLAAHGFINPPPAGPDDYR